MIRFSYQLHDFRHWLTDFANLLGQPLICGRLELPPYLGEGYIRAGHLTGGISYVIMDLNLKKEVFLTRLPSDECGLCLFFHPAPLLTSTRKEEETILSSSSPVKRVGLFFPGIFLH